MVITSKHVHQGLMVSALAIIVLSITALVHYRKPVTGYVLYSINRFIPTRMVTPPSTTQVTIKQTMQTLPATAHSNQTHVTKLTIVDPVAHKPTKVIRSKISILCHRQAYKGTSLCRH